MSGDHTLFTTAEGIERLWEVSTPLLEDPPPVRPYPPGSWGPNAIHQLIAPARLAPAVRAGLAQPVNRGTGAQPGLVDVFSRPERAHRGAHRGDDPLEQRARRREVETDVLLAPGAERRPVAQRDAGLRRGRSAPGRRGRAPSSRATRGRSPPAARARDVRELGRQAARRATAVAVEVARRARASHGPPSRYAAVDAAIPSGVGPGDLEDRQAPPPRRVGVVRRDDLRALQARRG